MTSIPNATIAVWIVPERNIDKPNTSNRTPSMTARVLVETVPAHEGKDPAELAARCTTALRRLISRIYEAGHYPSSRHGHEEERYEVLARYVQQNSALPVEPLSNQKDPPADETEK
jgi:hypothetical protein